MIFYVIFGDFVGWDWGTPAILQQKHPWKIESKFGIGRPPPQLGQKTKFFDRFNLRAPLTITINIKVCIAGMHGGDVSHGDYCAPLPVGYQCSLYYNAVQKTLLAMSDETKENAYRCQGGEDLCRQPVQRSV